MIHIPAQLQLDGHTSITLVTPKSVERDLKELFDLVDQHFEQGTKGAIFAQIEPRLMRVTFCPPEIANRIAMAFSEGSSGEEETHL